MTDRKTITFDFGNVVATVHFPELTEEERERRMAAIHNQAAALLKKEAAA